MSVTRILCAKCGFPQAWCQCETSAEPPPRFRWQGDLQDDCWCREGNLLAHCECLGAIKWRNADTRDMLADAEIWFCSVGPVDEKNFAAGDDLFHSSTPAGLILGGEMARAIAEAILSAANPAR
jgi:hypothetical protein